MKYRYDIEQNTDEWFEIKLAKFSASITADLLMDKSNKGYINLINKIVEEKITGKQSESKSFKGNVYTERGHEFEPIAADDYEMRYLEILTVIGVVELDEWCLCSPDRLIGDKGLLQIKCPIFNTQKEYLAKVKKHAGFPDNDILKKLSSSYYKQMQFELFVTGRDYNVFYSFHPSLKEIKLTVKRDEVLIGQIKQRIEEAKQEVLNEIKLLKSY